MAPIFSDEYIKTNCPEFQYTSIINRSLFAPARPDELISNLKSKGASSASIEKAKSNSYEHINMFQLDDMIDENNRRIQEVVREQNKRTRAKNDNANKVAQDYTINVNKVAKDYVSNVVKMASEANMEISKNRALEKLKDAELENVRLEQQAESNRLEEIKRTNRVRGQRGRRDRERRESKEMSAEAEGEVMPEEETRPVSPRRFDIPQTIAEKKTKKEPKSEF